MTDSIYEILKRDPCLLRRYERNEARYILHLSEDYEIMDVDFDVSKEELASFVIALAELNLTLDEWITFKLKELIISEKLAK